MNESPTRRPPHPLRWLRRIVIVLTALLLVAVCIVLLLPHLLSTEWFKSWVEKKASEALNRTVRVEQLKCRWTGILLEGLHLEDVPTFSSRPLLSIDRIKLNLRLAALLRRRFDFIFELDGLNARMIRNQDGRTNVDFLLKRTKEDIESEREQSATGWRDISIPIRLDVRCTAHFRGMSIALEDKSQGSTLHMKDSNLFLDIPSLSGTQSTMLRVSTEPILNGNELAPIRLEARVANLLNSSNALTANDALVDLKGNLPGCQIALHGDLKKSEINGRIAVDLARLMQVAQPLLPPKLSSTRVKGSLDLTVDGGADAGEAIAFELALAGKGVCLSGGRVGREQVGPVHWNAWHQGTLDAESGKLTIQEGEIHLMDKSRVIWQGALNRAHGPVSDLSLELRSASLDLSELRGLAEPFLPEGLEVQYADSDTAHAVANIKGWRLHGPLRPWPSLQDGKTSLELDQLTLRLPDLHLKSGHTAFSANDVHVSLDHFKTQVGNTSPFGIGGSATLALGRLHLEGPREVLLKRLDIGPIETSIGFGPQSPAILSIKTALKLQEMEVQGDEKSRIEGLEIPSLSILTHQGKGFPRRADIETDLRVRRMALTGVLRGTAKGVKVSSLRASTTFQERSLKEASVRTALYAEKLEVDGEKPVEIQGLEAASMDAAVLFENRFPSQTSLKTALRIENLRVRGKQELIMRGLEVPILHLDAAEIKPSKKALFGVSADLSLKESASIEACVLPALAEVSNLAHTLDARCILSPGPSGAIRLSRLDASIPFVLRQEVLGEPFKTHATVDSATAKLTITGRDPLRIDIEDFKSRIGAGDFLKATVNASAKNLAFDRLEGRARLNLSPSKMPVKTLWPKALRDVQWSDGDGAVALDCHLSGRLPREDELNGLMHFGRKNLEITSALNFLNGLEVLLQLKDLGVQRPASREAPRWRGLISTDDPIKMTMSDHGKKTTMGGSLVFRGIEIPSFSSLIGKPVDMTLNFEGSADALNMLRFSESSRIDALNLEQTAELTLSGLGRLLNRVFKREKPLAAAALTAGVGGSIRAELKTTPPGDQSSFREDLSVQGSLKTGAELRLIPGRTVLARAWLESPGADVRWDKGVQIEDLKSHLKLRKRYRISDAPKRVDAQRSTSTSLSQDVLRPLSRETGTAEVQDPVARRFFDDLRGRGSGQPSLSFERAQLALKPLPLQLSHNVLDFRLDDGLPAADYFKADLLGGTFIGAFSVSRLATELALTLRGSFSGINTQQLIPDAVRGVPDEQSEISGQFSLLTPLSTAPSSVLAGLRADVRLTSIGSQALGRILYALDPYENNEAIVNQRRQLRSGSPRWFHVAIQNGNLSIKGEVDVKGVRLRLPPLERLRLGSLPGLEVLDDHLRKLGPLIETLNILDANALVLDNQGKLRFVSSRLQQ